MPHLQRTVGNRAVAGLVAGDQTRQTGQHVQRTLEDAIVQAVHLDVNVKLPYSEDSMVEAIRGIDSEMSRTMLLNALLKGEDQQKQRGILDKLNGPPSFSCYSTGRVYSKGKKDDQYGLWESRMIMYTIDKKFNGFDVHVSIFPEDSYSDPWNITYNDATTYMNKGQAIQEANSASGNIDDHTTMKYNEFHVTFGQGSKSTAHYFYSTSGGFIKTDYNDQQMKRFADGVARWFLS